MALEDRRALMCIKIGWQILPGGATGGDTAAATIDNHGQNDVADSLA